MTEYLLDTDICIYILKGRIPNLESRLGTFKSGKVSVSAITVAELEYGVQKSSAPEKNGAAVIRLLASLDILPFGNPEADCYGRIRAALESQGRPIGALDMLIGAQALARNLVLVTNNTREFSRISGLMLDNWLD